MVLVLTADAESPAKLVDGNEPYFESTKEKVKHHFLLIAHAASSFIHLGILFFLFVEWNQTGNKQQQNFQIISLVIIGACLVIISILVFLLCEMEMKKEAHARRLFRIWPLFHIALATIYQLITQIITSHHPFYQIPSLYTAWATTFSVLLHIILHSVEVFL